MQINDIKQLRANIFGLSINCPFTGDNPTDCPLCKIRELTLKEKKAWVDGLTDKQCISIHEHHAECLNVKEIEK